MKSISCYLLTGATGSLGRNLLFEILKQNLSQLSALHIIILGRDQDHYPLKKRIMDIIENDGVHYLALEQEEYESYTSSFEKIITCIHFELDSDSKLSPEDQKTLSLYPIDQAYHIASHIDFRDSELIREKLWAINVDGTKRVLNLIDTLNVKAFNYVGSAYACGKTSGDIAPDYVNFEQEFRNPYELSKLEAEVLVRKHSETHSTVKHKFFRPSTISGRLLENKIGSISKFDVFYAWLFFFLRCKEKKHGHIGIEQAVEMSCRVTYSSDSGLNIVPVDYVAKALFILSHSDSKENSFHLVNDNECAHSLYVPAMANAINIKGIKAVTEAPLTELNQLEKLYYQTVGKIYTPYVNAKTMNFKTPQNRALPKCPEINKENFSRLIDFALVSNQ